MNFKSRKCEENGKKVLRYSIRKHHLGVASVAVASVLFFATGVATVQADGPGVGEPVSGTPAPPSTTSTLGTSGANTGDAEIENTNIDTNTAASTDSNVGNSLQGVPRAAEVRNGNDVPSTTLGSDRAVPTDIKPEDSDGARNNEEKPNYAGKVTLMKQWDVNANDPTIRKDTDRQYKTGEDKLGSPAFRSSTANTFLGWSDKPSVDGKIDEKNGARLFSPEDTLATAFPKGLKPDSKLYGVYTSFTKNEEPVPTDGRRYSILLKGLKRFTINANKVKIDTKVESEDVLPNTKLSKATEDVEDEKNTRRIIDKYNPENNDTTKVNEVVLKAEFEMDNSTAMTVYRNPDARGQGPVLSNSYKNNKFEIDEKKKTYTYVDLNVNLDKDLVVPEKLYAEFNGYSWRPLYAIGIKKDGTKEILNVYSKDGTNLGNTKDSFNSLVSNTDPKITFGVETKGYNNITFRMILRSLNEKDSNRPESERDKRNERIAESVIKPDEGKSIAETIMRNMTLKTLSSTELKTLFPDKNDEEINQMVVRIAQDKAKKLADTNGVLSVTGSVEGNVHPSAGRVGFSFLSFDLSDNLPIKEVKANVLELGYVHPYKATYKFISGTAGKDLPAAIEGYKPKDPKTYENTANVNAIQPTTTEYKVEAEDGKWVFKSYDAENKAVNEADVEFIGTWVFEANKYGVT
ncbi:SHIRT domain-containing protein, partial [Streptococcus pneumoniae]|uniref:SHIRT domain-containing protein n=2 Tax=Streptococcus pneumoniae TaxID=1313 RepID=UPI00123FCA74